MHITLSYQQLLTFFNKHLPFFQSSYCPYQINMYSHHKDRLMTHWAVIEMGGVMGGAKHYTLLPYSILYMV